MFASSQVISSARSFRASQPSDFVVSLICGSPIWTPIGSETFLPKHFRSRCRTRRRAHSNGMHPRQLKSIRASHSFSDCSFYEHPPSAPTPGKKGLEADDTPKSFLRLVNRKPRKELIAEGKIQVEKKKALKIEPGESIHEFKRCTCCSSSDLHW